MSYQAVRDAKQQSKKEFADLRRIMMDRAIKNSNQRVLNAGEIQGQAVKRESR